MDLLILFEHLNLLSGKTCQLAYYITKRTNCGSIMVNLAKNVIFHVGDRHFSNLNLFSPKSLCGILNIEIKTYHGLFLIFISIF